MLGELRSRVRKLLGPYYEQKSHYRRVQPYAMAFEQFPRAMPVNEVEKTEDQYHYARILDRARELAIHLPVPKYGASLHADVDRRHWSIGWKMGAIALGQVPEPELCRFTLEARLALAVMLAEEGIGPRAVLIGIGAQALALLDAVVPFLPDLQNSGIVCHYGTVGGLTPALAAAHLAEERRAALAASVPRFADLFPPTGPRQFLGAPSPQPPLFQDLEQALEWLRANPGDPFPLEGKKGGESRGRPRRPPSPTRPVLGADGRWKK